MNPQTIEMVELPGLHGLWCLHGLAVDPMNPEDAQQVLSFLGYGICIAFVVWASAVLMIFIDQLRKGRK